MNNPPSSRLYFKSNLAGTATVMLLSFLIFFVPPLLTFLARSSGPRNWADMGLVMACVYATVFFANYWFLIPRLLLRKSSNLTFIIANFVLIAGGCIAIQLLFHYHSDIFPAPHHNPGAMGEKPIGVVFRFMFRDAILMVLSVALAYTIRFYREREKMRNRYHELEAQRRELELQSLKSQLKPHFLFNSLNNIYALISIDPGRAQSALHDLSSMLRFMIYDSQAGRVSLEKEIGFINDYVSLMRLRLSSGISVDASFDNEPKDLMIPPLLFLTLIENAFKHVGTVDGKGFIRLSLRVMEGTLVFEASNSVGNASNSNENGVGLTNVRRQLELLYPGSHELTIDQSEKVFKVRLSLL